MGIDVANLKFLLRAHKQFGAFGSTLQLGRQAFYVGLHEMALTDYIVKRSGMANSLFEIRGDNLYADVFWGHLGADPLATMDISDYEGASIIHDLNMPVGPSLHNTFDTIHDGGTLEHIWNTPQAVANVYSMLKCGGRFLSCNRANNFLGHGFYQFSPEWAFRTFSPSNGFQMEMCFTVALDGLYDLTDAVDPEVAGHRIEPRMTSHSVYLMFAATKIDREVNQENNSKVQQSDYVTTWNKQNATA